MEPERRRGASQPAGLVPLLVHQRDAGVPAAEHGARVHRREAARDAERALLRAAGHAAAAGGRLRGEGVYTLDFPERPLKGAPRIARSAINGTYRGFMELIFQNNDTRMQSYHMDGYAFFVVG